MMSTARSRYPFTASQWQELEHQALIFKYMISGMPIPPQLLYTVRRSLDSSLSSKLLLHQPQQIGWSCFQMGFGRKIDPEPGRCRRTDGKKWRCSKEAYPDSKYCERHMHRGRNRSRKPVELITTNASASPTAMCISSSFTARNSSPSSPSPTTNSPSSSSHHSLSGLTPLAASEQPHHLHSRYSFLYPHSSSSRNLGSDFSSQENASSTTNNFLLESAAAYSHATGKGYSHGVGRKEEVNELPFFSETSGTMRSISGTSLHDSWQLTPLTMASPLTNNPKQSSYSEAGLQLHQGPDDNSSTGLKHDYFALDCEAKNDMYVQPKKVMHHFFDEWPPKDNKDSWFDVADDKLSRHGASSKIQLSISTPNSSHDFLFARNNEK